MVVMQRVSHEEDLEGRRLEVSEEGTVTQVTDTHAVVVGDVGCTDGPAWDELPVECLHLVLDYAVSRHHMVEWVVSKADCDAFEAAVKRRFSPYGVTAWLSVVKLHRTPPRIAMEATRLILEDLSGAA